MADVPPFDTDMYRSAGTSAPPPPPPPSLDDYQDPGGDDYDTATSVPAGPATPPPPGLPGPGGHQAPQSNAAVDVTRQLKRILAAFNGVEAGKLLDWLDQLDDADLVWADLGPQAFTWRMLADGLRSAYVSSRSSKVNLTGEAVRTYVTGRAATELADAIDIADSDPVEDRHLAWMNLLSHVTQSRSKQRVQALLEALSEPGARSHQQLQELYEQVVASPPTVSDADGTAGGVVRWGEEAGARAASRAANGGKVRFSSGFPTFDYALTRFHKNEMRGIVARGEYGVLYGGTGSGKSAAFRVLMRNIVVDMVERHGLQHAVVMLAYTEEDEDTVLDAMQMLPGQRFHRYVKHLALVEVNGNLEALHRALCVVTARQVNLSRRLGIPLEECLPQVLGVDYISGVAQSEGSNSVGAQETVTTYLMRGARKFDRRVMEKLTGTTYSEVTGEEWDERLDDPEMQMALIATSQINKKFEEFAKKPYRKGEPVDEYTKIGANGRPIMEPRVTDTGELVLEEAWPRPGDVPLLPKEAMFGASQLAKDVWWAVNIHRSRPDLKTVDAYWPDGSPMLDEHGEQMQRLERPESRLFLSKTRYGDNMNEIVPMAFDSGPNGFGMPFDILAVHLWNTGQYEPFVPEALTPWQPGDPMLPHPQSVDVFDVAY